MQKEASFPVRNQSRTATESGVGTVTLKNLPRAQNGETNQQFDGIDSFLSLKAKPHSLRTYEPNDDNGSGFSSRVLIKNGYGVHSRHDNTQNLPRTQNGETNQQIDGFDSFLRLSRTLYVPMN
jgi:hypothetical protein